MFTTNLHIYSTMKHEFYKEVSGFDLFKICAENGGKNKSCKWDADQKHDILHYPNIAHFGEWDQ